MTEEEIKAELINDAERTIRSIQESINGSNTNKTVKLLRERGILLPLVKDGENNLLKLLKENKVILDSAVAKCNKTIKELEEYIEYQTEQITDEEAEKIHEAIKAGATREEIIEMLDKEYKVIVTKEVKPRNTK